MKTLQAVIGNRDHPEYGEATIPFPIVSEEYDGIMKLLEPLEIGDVLRQDCHIREIVSEYPVLKQLETRSANIDELDYLAKRLDSFGSEENVQFNGTASAEGIRDIRDFINLTFCCQNATVVENFQDLEKIGKDHYMAVNGGSVPMEEWKTHDFRQEAVNLLQSGTGKITPYGVVYENGMKLEPLYQGGAFPEYMYEENVAATVEDGKGKEYTILLPKSKIQIERELERGGMGKAESLSVKEIDPFLPEKWEEYLDPGQRDLYSLNWTC